MRESPNRNGRDEQFIKIYLENIKETDLLENIEKF
jgi:hypothetical protein